MASERSPSSAHVSLPLPTLVEGPRRVLLCFPPLPPECAAHSLPASWRLFYDVVLGAPISPGPLYIGDTTNIVVPLASACPRRCMVVADFRRARGGLVIPHARLAQQGAVQVPPVHRALRRRLLHLAELLLDICTEPCGHRVLARGRANSIDERACCGGFACGRSRLGRAMRE